MIAHAVTITDTPTLIAEVSGASIVPNSILVHSLAGNDTVYLGGSDVATTNGFPLDPGATLGWDLVGEEIYGVVASGTAEVRVLRRGRGA